MDKCKEKNQKMPFWWGIAAVAYWILTFFTDQKMFSDKPLEMGCFPIDEAMAPVMHVLTKILLLGFLLLLFYFLEKARKKLVLLFAFLFYMALYCLGLFLCYPGYYMNDDAILFAYASRYYPVYWHNYLTSLFYMVGMSFFPASCGPVLLSDVIYAMVYAYLFDRAKTGLEKTGKKSRWSNLLLLIGMLPFVLLGALMCFRPAVYSGFFVFFFGFLFCEWKEAKPLTKTKLVGLAIVLSLLAFWRSESIVLLPIGVLLLALTYYPGRFFTKDCLGSAFLFVLMAVLFFAVMKIPQSIGEKKYYGKDYLIISTTRPLSVIVHRPQNYAGAFEDFQNIDKVTKIDYLKSDTLSCSAYNRYNSDKNNGSFTQTMASKEEQDSYMKSAIRLIWHNLDLYLGERLQLFLVTNGIFDYDRAIVGGLEMTFQGGYPQYEHDRAYSMGMLEAYKRIPIASQTGYAMALFCYGGEAYLPMLGLTILCFLMSLLKKKWFCFFGFFALLAREIVVFLTAPTSFIQYSYPMMYVTALYTIFLLADWRMHLSEKMKRDNKKNP